MVLNNELQLLKIFAISIACGAGEGQICCEAGVCDIDAGCCIAWTCGWVCSSGNNKGSSIVRVWCCKSKPRAGGKRHNELDKHGALELSQSTVEPGPSVVEEAFRVGASTLNTSLCKLWCRV